MEGFIKGDVVVVPFSFSDLSSTKKRPALVLANSTLEDVILCQITSKLNGKRCIYLEALDFKSGKLNRSSYIRPNRIFTANNRIVLYKIGTIKTERLIQVRDSIVSLLDN